MREAIALQSTDPAAATRVWAKVDRDVVDHAPWVFVATWSNLDFVSRRVGNSI